MGNGKRFAYNYGKNLNGELIRVLKEYNITLSEGDTITFESK